MKVQDFRFEKLEAYQRARVLLRRVYHLTSKWPRQYLFDLSSQLRRAALSVLLNIAEGSGRGEKDFARYLTIAIGSCKECSAIMDVAFDLGLIDDRERVSFKEEFIEISMMLGGLKKSLK